jgi:hypothetical protein
MKFLGARGAGSQQLVELEKRVHEFLRDNTKATSAQVCQRADDIAHEMGMSSFKSSFSWYTKITKKHARENKAAANGGKSKEQKRANGTVLQEEAGRPSRLSGKGALEGSVASGQVRLSVSLSFPPS